MGCLLFGEDDRVRLNQWGYAVWNWIELRRHLISYSKRFRGRVASGWVNSTVRPHYGGPRSFVSLPSAILGVDFSSGFSKMPGVVPGIMFRQKSFRRKGLPLPEGKKLSPEHPFPRGILFISYWSELSCRPTSEPTPAKGSDITIRPIRFISGTGVSFLEAHGCWVCIWTKSEPC